MQNIYSHITYIETKQDYDGNYVASRVTVRKNLDDFSEEAVEVQIEGVKAEQDKLEHTELIMAKGLAEAIAHAIQAVSSPDISEVRFEVKAN